MSTQAKTIITIVGVGIVLGYFVWTQSATFGPLTLAREIGLALAAIAFILWIVARLQLGKSFSVQAKASELVTRGIYSKIRNPVYVFGTLFMFGMILWMGRPILLLVFLAIIPLQVIRAKKEAQVLEAKFGDAYREYRSKTWF
ncbi:MAG TPA: isoprenylcysteine carboxylmethyltransferase family protein [Candidatus Acidoferrales bacterium]|nr:isoprenylcysteine carboxylmethyltransferase family protein [Candidatus Acidoferrales bacterium]